MRVDIYPDTPKQNLYLFQRTRDMECFLISKDRDLKTIRKFLNVWKLGNMLLYKHEHMGEMQLKALNPNS